VHLVAFIKIILHDSRSSECQKRDFVYIKSAKFEFEVLTVVLLEDSRFLGGYAASTGKNLLNFRRLEVT